MKTQKLTTALKLAVMIYAFVLSNNVFANRMLFLKTIKEGVLQSQSLHENKRSSKVIHHANVLVSNKINVSQKNSSVGSRLIKNKINPRICFTVSRSGSSKDHSINGKDIHAKRLAIFCLGRFVIPAANVLLILF